MPLNASQLATELQAKITATFGSPTDSALSLQFYRALAEAIIDHLKNNGVVTPDSMNAGGDPVQGTGKIT